MLLILVGVGVGAGIVLVAMLASSRWQPALRLWPPATKGSWRSILFWGLFRTLNVSALAVAWVDWQPLQPDHLVRIAAAIAASATGAGYLAACFHLGRVNLYGGRAGLVTDGLYRLSRNPQYALAMPAYVALALAADSVSTAALVVLLIAVFNRMAVLEEPWLRSAYGEAYVQYATIVPRFYNVRLLLEALSSRAVQRS